MYKLMIVDDDRHIRERLKNLIDWNELGICICGEAADGDEAMLLYEQENPALAILDINIPNKSGLDVAKEILSLDPETIIISITGFNDFEYAQRALKLGVFDFISKPLDLDEIISTLKKAIHRLVTIKKERQNSEKLKALVIESLPLLRTNFISDLLYGKLSLDSTAIESRLEHFDINISYNYYTSAIIIPQLQAVSEKDIDISIVAICNISEELLQNAGFKCFSFLDSLNSVIILLSWQNTEDILKLDDIFSTIRNKVNYYFSIDMYVSIGSVVQNISSLHCALADAREALNYKNIFARNNIVNIKNVIKILNKPSQSFMSECNNIICLFKAGDMSELIKKVNSLASSIAAISLGKINGPRQIFIELTVMVIHVASDIGVDLTKFSDFDEPYQQIFNFSNLKDIVEWFISLCRILIKEIDLKKENRTNRIIVTAQDYINAHLSDNNLGLVSVSDHVELSSVYFCQLFHAEIGVGINQYINTLRIEKAKDYLKNSTMKIYEISCVVGYSNPKYFNYIFKKSVGVTPREYRSTL